jgi:type VI protein secretion system component VasF
MDSKFRDKSELLSLISDIKDDLYDLSKVQLKEGKRQMSLSEKTMDTIELFTQVEIIFLIVMAVLIQLIVLYQPKDKKQSQAQE